MGENMNIIELLNTANNMIELVNNTSDLIKNVHFDKIPSVIFLFGFNVNYNRDQKRRQKKLS